MRVAWIGPAPSDEGGVAYAGTQLLRGLSRESVDLDCFVAAHSADGLQALVGEGVEWFHAPPSLPAERWTGKSPLGAFIAGQLDRAVAQARLARLIADRHAVRPYDIVYQFSQIELGWLRTLRRRLPPIVLHPEVHAAGELRWHRREEWLTRRAESRRTRVASRVMLTSRALAQSQDIRLARMVISPSRRFGELLASDYRVPSSRLRVVPNPIDLERFTPATPSRNGEGPVRILFVSRIAVRKGVEMMVDLSHRLADLEGTVKLEVVGDGSLWSDYRPLLAELHPQTAEYVGPATPRALPELYRRADVLVQPAHYEPLGLTVGEALASGLPVVTSDEVGAAEGVDERCCRVFPAGDRNAFEVAVRRLVADVRGESPGPALREIARSEAERLFAPREVSVRLKAALEEAAG